MATRYFSKLTPATLVPLGSGGTVRFSTNDGLRGYFQTDDPYFISEFIRLMREGRSALTEISEQEWTEQYLQKKTEGTSLKPIWREELVKGSPTGVDPLSLFGVSRVQAVVGVSKGPPVKLGVAMESAPEGAPLANGDPKPQEKQPFDVPVGVRKKPKAKA